MTELRAGVVGAGVFGGYHAHKYAALPGVTLAGVLDADPERGAVLANKLGARAYTDPDAFMDGLDVVTVACPASAHAELTAKALERGLHVYVEKPIALTVADAQALVALAEAHGLVLACGHQERAIFRAMGLLDAPETPVRIEAVRRSSYYPGRGTDVSCGLDIMIHDYDLGLALNRSAPVSVKASGRIVHGPCLDEIFTEVVFADGMVLTVDGSRLDEGRKRTMKIVFPSGTVELDFMAKTFSNSTGFALDPGYAETPDGKDPLGASVSAFLSTVRGDAARPLVTGNEAARALALALEVDSAVKP